MDDKSILPTANPEYTNIESAPRGTQIAESGNIFLVDSSSNVLETHNENIDLHVAYKIKKTKISR